MKVPPEQIVFPRVFAGSPPFQLRQAMRYQIYSGPRGSAAISPLEQERMLFQEADTLEAALHWARHLVASGRVPLLIEGDDGTRLDKQAIAAALAHGKKCASRAHFTPRPSVAY
jgi:hypothetical protein